MNAPNCDCLLSPCTECLHSVRRRCWRSNKPAASRQQQQGRCLCMAGQDAMLQRALQAPLSTQLRACTSAAAMCTALAVRAVLMDVRAKPNQQLSRSPLLSTLQATATFCVRLCVPTAAGSPHPSRDQVQHGGFGWRRHPWKQRALHGLMPSAISECTALGVGSALRYGPCRWARQQLASGTHALCCPLWHRLSTKLLVQAGSVVCSSARVAASLSAEQHCNGMVLFVAQSAPCNQWFRSPVAVTQPLTVPNRKPSHAQSAMSPCQHRKKLSTSGSKAHTQGTWSASARAAHPPADGATIMV